MTDGRRQEVRLEIRIDAAPETVFALLTEPAQMQTWLAEAVDANARPGGVFRISGPSGTSIEGTKLDRGKVALGPPPLRRRSLSCSIR